MSDLTVEGTALALMLVALPLISAGAWNDVAPLWGGGLVVLFAGALLPTIKRFAGSGDASEPGPVDSAGADR